MDDAQREKAFGAFLQNANRLLADERLREVLTEIDASGRDALEQLGPDATAALRFRGVDIPQDYRVELVEDVEDAAAAAKKGKGTSTTKYCLRICWWRWCVEVCVVIERTTTVAA